MNCEIIQEKYYSKQADRHGKKFNRMNDVITTIDWLLGQDPLYGEIVNGPHRIFKTTAIADTPSFWVLYRYDEEGEKVHLLSIDIADSD